MERKKILIAGLICALTAAVLAVVLWRGPSEQPPAEPAVTVPATQTQPTLPVQPTVPETTVPVGTTEPQDTAPRSTEPAETEPAETEPEPTDPIYSEPTQPELPVYETVRFPLELEDGKLTVQSIFQFTGMNPDVQNLFGEDIAGLQMTNTSDEHMTYAEITAVLADGTTLTFLAEDVPPGMTVMAFCREHETLTDPESCETIFGYAEFEDTDPRLPELLQLSVSGTEITVTNLSGEDLTDLNVICHGLLDGSCFGGTTYHYIIPSLSAGTSTIVHAVDCILGMAEVVRVELGG